jgi:hypothetical protein
MICDTHRVPVNGNAHSFIILCFPPLATWSINTITYHIIQNAVYDKMGRRHTFVPSGFDTKSCKPTSAVRLPFE